MKKKLRAVGILTIASLLPFNTASGALASHTPMSDNLDSLGIAESNEDMSNGLIAEANTAERGDSGTFVSVTWSVENNSGSEVYFGWPHGQSYTYSDPTYYSGVTATSKDGANRHHPLMDSTTECLCSGNTSTEFLAIINPGEKVAYWSMYSVPEDVDAITLEIPGFEPIEDIPIS